MNRFLVQNPPYLYILNENLSRNRFDQELGKIESELNLSDFRNDGDEEMDFDDDDETYVV